MSDIERRLKIGIEYLRDEAKDATPEKDRECLKESGEGMSAKRQGLYRSVETAHNRLCVVEGKLKTLFNLVENLGKPKDQPEPKLKRHQPCGCILCICGDEKQCHGCGAKNCNKFPKGEHPKFEYEPEVKPEPQSESDKYLQAEDERVCKPEPCRQCKNPMEKGICTCKPTVSEEPKEEQLDHDHSDSIDEDNCPTCLGRKAARETLNKVCSSKEEQLLPCPFCGSSFVYVTADEHIPKQAGHFLGPQCKTCGAWIKNIDSNKAVNSWNRRPAGKDEVSKLKDRIKELDELSKIQLQAEKRFLHRIEQMETEDHKNAVLTARCYELQKKIDGPINYKDDERYKTATEEFKTKVELLLVEKPGLKNYGIEYIMGFMGGMTTQPEKRTDTISIDRKVAEEWLGKMRLLDGLSREHGEMFCEIKRQLEKGGQ